MSRILIFLKIIIKGIIFWIENKIKIIIQSIYIEIIGNQKWRGGMPSLIRRLSIMIWFINEE
jgi:hypothetical protein